jgi:hypothetical protein
VRGCRGVSTVKSPRPLLRTPISSQRSAPVNTPAPGLRVTVNKPLLTATGEFVIGPATTPGPPLES